MDYALLGLSYYTSCRYIAAFRAAALRYGDRIDNR